VAATFGSIAMDVTLTYHRIMAWIEGHDDELRRIAQQLMANPNALADKWASSALRAGEFQWAIESMLAEAAAKEIDLPNNLIREIRKTSIDLLPEFYQNHELVAA